jgi:hypothetical protein
MEWNPNKSCKLVAKPKMDACMTNFRFLLKTNGEILLDKFKIKSNNIIWPNIIVSNMIKYISYTRCKLVKILARIEEKIKIRQKKFLKD